MSGGIRHIDVALVDMIIWDGIISQKKKLFLNSYG